MNLFLLYIIGSFVVSMACGFLFIPLVIAYCKKKKLYDLPNARKVHKCGVPRLGGICFLPCMFLASMLAMFVFNGTSETECNKITLSLWSVYFFVSLLLIYSVGLIDDFVGLEARTKFVVQLLAASLFPCADLYINNLYGFCGIYHIPFYVGAPLTVFVIVFIDNAMNLIDGIDGLSAGISLMALSGFLYYFLRDGLWVYSILIAGLMGVLTSFVYYNVFGKAGKNKIFMGDSGSLTLGFILGFLFVKFSMDNPHILPFRRDSMLLAYTLLIVPVFDVCRVILARMRHHKPIFGADKNHIHHKMMRASLSQHQALVAILCVSLLYVVVNNLLANFCNITLIVFLDILLWCVIQGGINYLIRKNNREVFYREQDSNV